jgi:hypothetical protein
MSETFLHLVQECALHVPPADYIAGLVNPFSRALVTRAGRLVGVGVAVGVEVEVEVEVAVGVGVGVAVEVEVEVEAVTG